MISSHPTFLLRFRPYRPLVLLGSLAAAFLLAGCNTNKTYEVDVVAKSEPQKMLGRESYRITTRNRENDESSLRYKEAEEQIRTALSGIGMYEAPNPEEADMVVEIDYGISSPKEVLVEYQEPVYVAVPGKVSYITQTVRQKDGKLVTVRVPVYEPPRQVFAGTQTRVKPITVYDKYLTISGVGLNRKQGDEIRDPIWSVSVSSQNESDDLREHIPVMAAAALDYIGTSTEKEQKVRIKASDEDVAFIKAGYSEDGPFSTASATPPASN